MNIVLFALTVMYTPGPVNLLGLNAGLQRPMYRSLGFFGGVGLAIFLWFLVIGYAGQRLVVAAALPYLAALGSAYILYLAYSLYRAAPPSPASSTAESPPVDHGRLRFRDGFLMQLLNPKNSLLVVPITTILFPGRGIADTALILWSAGIALGGAGAPALYCAAGKGLAQWLGNARYYRVLNRAMAALLVLVAATMLLEYTLMPIIEAH
ncbi:LysE family translocator [Larsenimonas salina]|uniref:LysE family translocator n=1 Tax=Larsenimonas salina TaxID=1295565 RepID=UPI0020731E49|nr:LysE family transporter [Larsenimonas salina]MCM5704248.1 LysE family transporter [Larsenimonas salina]